MIEKKPEASNTETGICPGCAEIGKKHDAECNAAVLVANSSKTKRQQDTADLLILLGVLYERGPRTLEDLTKALEAPNRVSDARVNGLVNRAGHLVEWLGLS